MKVTRLLLACTLLLLAAVPMSAATAGPALPQCGNCDDNNQCVHLANSGVTCRYSGGTCIIEFKGCSGFAPGTTLASDWTVASIEIERPALDAKTVTAPAAVAEVRTTQPTEQK